MNILFICKASIETGFGHLIRSRSLALQIRNASLNNNIVFKVIGESVADRLLSDSKLDYSIYKNELDCSLHKHYDICYLDMISITEELFTRVSNLTKLKVSISPIFNKMSSVDAFFNRTKYNKYSDEQLPLRTYGSLDYTIIQEDCKKINTYIYEENLKLKNFPIAICMGGGDAANKTLEILKALKNCEVPATFWVMLGEGYKHSYDKLIDVIKSNSNHEIILAKTNKSMWQILRNCTMAILPGGITTYEAAYAGLPTINLLEQETSFFLIQELEENNVCRYQGLFNYDNIQKLNETIKYLYENRKELLLMHLNTKDLIKDQSGLNIFKTCVNLISTENSTANMT